MSQRRFTNDKDRTFTVRIVRKGDAYGLNGCLTHDDDRPVVELYDATYDIERFWNIDPTTKGRGQFVSRYFFTTLLESSFKRALCLHGGQEDVWSIDAMTMNDIVVWVDEELHDTVDAKLNRGLDAIIDVATKE